MEQYQYKWQTMTEEFSANASPYTVALAASMNDTRNALLRRLLDDTLYNDMGKHEIEVNFDGQE